MYPWDQDKTWGYHDAIRGYEVFYDMPTTFGMKGDRPPGYPKNLPAPQNFSTASWWRPGGHFSQPLLANPQFRKLFLARTKELLETVYTEEVFFPLIDKMGDRVKEDVRIRAQIRGENPKQSAEHLRRNLESLKEHLTKRRKFLLEQDEIKKAGKFDRKVLTSWLMRPLPEKVQRQQIFAEPRAAVQLIALLLPFPPSTGESGERLAALFGRRSPNNGIAFRTMDQRSPSSNGFSVADSRDSQGP
jgi:hypothetical protein